jgi:FKBP-type peptidyl-prolyl cis-trans isomerase FklB
MYLKSAILAMILSMPISSFAQTELERKETETAIEPDKESLGMAIEEKLAQKEAEAVKARAERNKKEGEGFLAENKTKEGVITLPSGLQYKILKTGDGAVPTETDTVEVRYRGTFINTTQFANSINPPRSSFFPVNRVIRGWQEALKLMRVGSKWQLFIPPDLAYGERGFKAIEPNTVVIFEIELIGIKSPDKLDEKTASDKDKRP